MTLPYKLLTPGPLTTSQNVKKAMLVDHCTWDDDYKQITQEIRKELLNLAQVHPEQYTTVLMQGSGTFAVESVLTSVIAHHESALVISNGAYGERIAQILTYAKINFVCLRFAFSEAINIQKIIETLKKHPQIKHIIMVHCETTTGILNDIKTVGKISHDLHTNFIVDAMSSFGGIEIPMQNWHIDYLISSANKCIQGVPGFSFVIANRIHLNQCKNIARSLSLDLYHQWQEMEKDGKWRFTSPTHCVLAFKEALKELALEGGIYKRYCRYQENNRLIRKGLAEIGFIPYIKTENQSPFITTFLLPNKNFNFSQLYTYVKAQGYAIYPGKLTDVDTFRIGNIGEIYQEDVLKIIEIFKNFMKE